MADYSIGFLFLAFFIICATLYAIKSLNHQNINWFYSIEGRHLSRYRASFTKLAWERLWSSYLNEIVDVLVVTFHCLIIELSPFLLLKLNGGLWMWYIGFVYDVLTMASRRLRPDGAGVVLVVELQLLSHSALFSDTRQTKALQWRKTWSKFTNLNVWYRYPKEVEFSGKNPRVGSCWHLQKKTGQVSHIWLW